MLPLFDMIANAQNGRGIEELSRQFGLSQAQTQEAIEALLPAFSQGLKRNASDPYGIGAFLNAVSTGRHAQYFEDATRAASPEGTTEGNGILGHLFGSKELSRAVAAQAAMSTGIAQETLKKMLPVLAAMIMGGIFKQSTGGMQAGASSGGGMLGEILEQMMRQGGGGTMRMPHPEAPQPGANPFDNPFGKVLEEMFGGGRSGAQGQGQPQTPYGDNPLGRIFEEMLRQGQGQPQEQPRQAPQRQTTQRQTERRQSEPEPSANPSGRARNPYDDLFGQMFETGRQTRDEYQRGMESIFDQFRKGMDRHR
ncbi:hypothetical protein L598_002000000510 [Mesorhizobium sp. J18]|uniref:DUF937 domain-containing protein n=1 Tax=Mesorhizobium sp. J18 TaxID=935263 RepID=UPI00119C48DE|nr:DUF937 domain-containing protein [Mesorhizobium sp. J18]TWG97487.1 hypothetical protein L598_002000000510 [Mesorhizobium sp. J18]